jgi:hypothetical protein
MCATDLGQCVKTAPSTTSHRRPEAYLNAGGATRRDISPLTKVSGTLAITRWVMALLRGGFEVAICDLKGAIMLSRSSRGLGRGRFLKIAICDLKADYWDYCTFGHSLTNVSGTPSWAPGGIQGRHPPQQSRPYQVPRREAGEGGCGEVVRFFIQRVWRN